jgi:hypothetical protein
VTTAAVFSPKFITVLGCNLLRGTTTLDCALLETFFHDLPCKAGFKPVSKRKLIVKVHSIVLPKIGLHIVDLGTIALHKLGIDRAHLIETTKAFLPAESQLGTRVEQEHADLRVSASRRATTEPEEPDPQTMKS